MAASEFPNLPKRWFVYNDFRIDLSELISIGVMPQGGERFKVNVRFRGGGELNVVDLERDTARAFLSAFDTFHGVA